MAPRKRRNQNDEWMPPRVYRGRSAYEWHPKEGGAVRLCKLTADKVEVWNAYDKAYNESLNQENIDYIIKEYYKDERFTELARNTQDDYKNCEQYISKTFGTMHPAKITPVHIRQFLQKRGQISRSRANRERVFLSNVLQFAIEIGIAPKNPAKEVKPLKTTRAEREQPKRYVEDWEYLAVYEIAPDLIKSAMEVSYLCAARQRDVLDLRLTDLKDDGILICQGKTRKRQIKGWTPRLRDAINLAKSRPSKINTILLFHTREGMAYSSSGFKSIWKRYIKKALDEKLIQSSFTFHDLKRKGITDFEGSRKEKQEFSGHAQEKMLDIYDVKPAKVSTIKKPLKK